MLPGGVRPSHTASLVTRTTRLTLRPDFREIVITW